MKNIRVKYKVKGKFTGSVVRLQDSMLSQGLTEFALYRLTTDDNALRKGWRMPPKITTERI
jgi:hypothetical protein